MVVDVQSDRRWGTLSWDARRMRIIRRDDYTCQYCGFESNNPDGLGLNVHHIVHRANGGRDEPENLTTLCQECHNELHSMFDKPINEWIRSQIEDAAAVLGCGTDD